MDTQLEEIRKLITDKAKKSRVVSGGDLGTSIKRLFPDLKMSSVYGGLKKFISEYCEEVKWIRKQGGDDIYVLASWGIGANDENEYSKYDVSNKPITGSFWQAFSNPSVKLCLILNKNSGDLFLIDEDSNVIEPYIKINKVTREEYRAIASDFIPKIAEPFRTEFSKVIPITDFWSHWSTLINNHKKEGIFDEWVKWRAQKVIEVYENRLRSAGLTESVIETAKINLRRGKATDPLAEKKKTDNKFEMIQKDSLKSIVHAVIDKLPEEELKRIWLPVGLFFDELNKHNSNQNL